MATEATDSRSMQTSGTRGNSAQRIARTDAAGLAVLLLCATLACGTHAASPSDRWVATWTAAQQDYNESLKSVDVTVPPPDPLVLTNVTVRQIIHVSIGGAQLRIKLSNLFGTAPVQFAAVHLARSTGGSAVDPAADLTVTFAGATALAVPAGAEVWSDTVAFALATHEDVAVSVYLPTATQVATVHTAALQTNYVMAGDATAWAVLDGAQEITLYNWLAAVDVSARADARVVVAFGDSLTDGTQSTIGADHRWPNALDTRLQADSSLGAISVVNAGIAGNRWRHDAIGPNGSGRFARDVLGVSGVTDVILFLGINDIGASVLVPSQAVTPEQVTAAIDAAIQAAQAQGIRVSLATLLPFKGAFDYSDAGEVTRQAVNTWIRAQTALTVLDLEAAVRDPAHPDAISPLYNAGDNLHLNDAGYAQVAATIAASLFLK